ncbi:hypothetical protein C9374_003772 [Naegleria lovaniensis]|uniref:Uncharacterized protein n=1 Tax=Naegleria lovaniensis TaxID=51637 RepID=A0AA88GZQ9_NAELO|nr:uncharacterized protein C9374_003772 [Naegleria lovaniensis]KAG2394008.1 hypothetical protein C9374_003772 [Naegleria lovaniensis]
MSSFRNHDSTTRNNTAAALPSSSTQPSLSEKLSLVNEWLTYDLLQQDIPPFEKNETTINLLYQLVLYSRKQSLQSNTLMNHYKQKIVEYQSERNRMEYLLKSLHLNKSVLDPTFQKAHQVIPNQTHHMLLRNDRMHGSDGRDVHHPLHHRVSNIFTNQREPEIIQNDEPETSTHQLSKKENTSLHQLAELASLLKLNKPSQSYLMDALYDLSNEHSQTLQESHELKMIIQDLSKKTIEIIQKTHYLNEIYQQFNEEIQQREVEDSLQERLSTIEYLKRKSQEYQIQITQLQQELSESLLLANHMDVSQSFLIDMYNKIQNLKKEMTPKLAIIEKYHHLPPDVHQVQLRISHAKQELKQLEDIFNRKAQHIWFD